MVNNHRKVLTKLFLISFCCLLIEVVGLIQDRLKPYPSNKFVNFDYCKRAAVHLFYKVNISVSFICKFNVEFYEIGLRILCYVML